MTATLPYAAIMVAAGIGIPIMATLNSGLGARVANPTFAACILFLVAGTIAALVLITTALFTTSRVPAAATVGTVPAYYFAGGLFVAFYVLSITWLAPRLGVGTAVFLVLFGQLLATAAIDHYGWLGALQTRLTPQRVAGLALMIVGIYLARRID